MHLGGRDPSTEPSTLQPQALLPFPPNQSHSGLRSLPTSATFHLFFTFQPALCSFVTLDFVHDPFKTLSHIPQDVLPFFLPESLNGSHWTLVQPLLSCSWGHHVVCVNLSLSCRSRSPVQVPACTDPDFPPASIWVWWGPALTIAAWM